VSPPHSSDEDEDEETFAPNNPLLGALTPVDSDLYTPTRTANQISTNETSRLADLSAYESNEKLCDKASLKSVVSSKPQAPTLVAANRSFQHKGQKSDISHTAESRQSSTSRDTVPSKYLTSLKPKINYHRLISYIYQKHFFCI